ncbi:hypothetical protein CXF72_07575 [Psychromonas sp. MB-3u-54]|uniref:DUF4382 domain-containing protein n=1 Tax=Psychromonas sp. MB-3u-54 TaxID=2058319 RepID=UPI000C330B0A|nr:DUF4382 domain-containing protein [Psychromonas sp. MB-3u-54]PKH03176.1 hypothetical protein CXF72_07575 [Psychromonas sp. MB-3u-54]
MKYKKNLFALSLTTLLTACNSGSDDTKMGKFNLAVSDNPADAKVVNISFKQVVLKNYKGAISFDVSEDGGLKNVDLIKVQGSEMEVLVSGQSIPVGEYQMCIYMEKNEDPNNETSSYVKTMNGSIAGLTTNSKGSCGGVGAEDSNTGRLFINKKFTIAAGSNNFVAEFDLLKIMQGPKGNKDYWTLKPTGIELINLSDVGSISGEISINTSIDCRENAGHAVYLYPSDTSLANMSDFRGNVVAPAIAPIASARANAINDDITQGYNYEFGFVVAGSYSLGYTCTAQNDDPELANEENFFIHSAREPIDVTAENPTTVATF